VRLPVLTSGAVSNACGPTDLGGVDRMPYDAGMARYDFRCRTCDSLFEVERPMSQSSEPAYCPDGHADTVKLLSKISVLAGATPGRAPAPSPMPSGGGCGGACACAH
jgi:putative FmdB family regulatory protein